MTVSKVVRHFASFMLLYFIHLAKGIMVINTGFAKHLNCILMERIHYKQCSMIHFPKHIFVFFVLRTLNNFICDKINVLAFLFNFLILVFNYKSLCISYIITLKIMFLISLSKNCFNSVVNAIKIALFIENYHVFSDCK